MFFVGHVLGQFDCTRPRNYCQFERESVDDGRSIVFQLLQEMLHIMTKGGEELLKFERDAPARLSRNPVPLFIGFVLCLIIESETHCHTTFKMVHQGLGFSILKLTPQKPKKDIDFFELFGIKGPPPTYFDDSGPTPDFSVDQMFMADDFFCQPAGTFPQPMACLTESEMIDKFKETATRGIQALPKTGDKLQAIVDSGATVLVRVKVEATNRRISDYLVWSKYDPYE
jgi:hypothetical protein